MKKSAIFISFNLFIFLLLSMPTVILAETTDSIEIRLRTFLDSYLHNDEYMVYVNEIKSRDALPQTPETQNDLVLPGVPGLDEKTRNVYSFDIRNEEQSAHIRTPFEISVVVEKNIEKRKIGFLRKVLPQIARVDQSFGDRFNFKVGPLVKAKREDPPLPSFVDDIMKYRNELISLGFGLFSAVAALILLSGFLSIMGAFVGRKTKSDPTSQLLNLNQAPSATPSIRQPNTINLANESDSTKHLPIGRSTHGEGAIIALIEELRIEAKTHPAALAQLLTLWVQGGANDQRHCGLLLAIFDIDTVNQIMKEMVPSDLDKIAPHINLEFDPKREENLIILIRAKQDLFKIAARSNQKKEYKLNLDFLSKSEDDVLAEILRGEPPQVFALISTIVPVHRFIDLINLMPNEKQSEYFQTLCHINSMPQTNRQEIESKLRTKFHKISEMSLTQNEKSRTITSILRQIQNPDRKKFILNEIKLGDIETYNQIKYHVLLFDDIMHLSDKALKILMIATKAESLAIVFSNSDRSLNDRVINSLNKSQAEIFIYELKRGYTPPIEEIYKHQSELISRLEFLIDQGLIARKEIQRNDTAAPSLRLAG
ncbi:MAG: hypothetical protein H6623_00245 [Bdellovibrionaceae bacterium]|nr:hypothetical protein [Pseudobdellovibrionaceae bacterium]